MGDQSLGHEAGAVAMKGINSAVDMANQPANAALKGGKGIARGAVEAYHNLAPAWAQPSEDTYQKTIAAADSAPDPMGWVADHLPGNKVEQALPKPEANTDAGRYLGSTAEMLPYVLNPEGFLGKGIMGAAKAGAKEILSKVPEAILPGVGAQGMEDYFKGTTWEPYAKMIGGLLGGAATGAVKATAESAAPLASKEARLAGAGQRVLESSDNPENLRTWANTSDPAADRIIDPAPLTSHLIPDAGISDTERLLRTTNPSLFEPIDRQSNAARVGVLRSIDDQNAAASPDDLRASLEQQKRQIDDLHAHQQQQVEQFAQDRADALGGNRNTEDTGQVIKNKLDPQYQAEQQSIAAHVGDLGSTPPNVAGAGMRGAAQSALNDTKTRESAIWKAIDPNGTLAMPLDRMKQAVDRIYGGMGLFTKPPTAGEQELLARLQAAPDTVPFRDGQQLSSWITGAMRETRDGDPVAHARLTQLKQAFEDTLTNTVANQHAQEQAAVAAGRLSPDDTMAANFQRQFDEWRAARQASEGSASNSPANARSASPGGMAPVSPPLRNRLPPAGGGRDGAGHPGVADMAGGAEPGPFDDAARQRYAAAKTATKDRVGTFQQGPVGKILRTQGTATNYRVSDGAVPGMIFKRGAEGGEAVQAYRRAIGNDAGGVEALHNAAAYSLRQAAERADGTLDPARYAAWRKAYGSALSQMPELAQRFDTLAQASDSLKRFGRYSPDVSAAQTPGMFFASGPAGREGVDHLRNLIGDKEATAILSDHAASLLKAMHPEGGPIQQARLNQFTRRYGDALDALPGLKDRFSSAAKATQSIADAAVARKQALDDFQAGSVGKILRTSDPTEVRDRIGNMIAGNDVTGLRRLAEAAKTDPNARAGLQKAATEWILQRFLNTTESGVGGEKGLAGAGLIKTLNKSRSALEQVLDPEQMNSLQAVVADFERANRSVTAVRVKGSPNTAADLLRAQRAEGHHMPLWQKLFAIREVTEHLPEHILGLPLAKLAIPYAFGRQMLDVLHEAGHRKVADVVKQAILDPNVMRAAIKAADSRGAPVGFIKAVARHSMMGATAASQPARQALAQ